MPAANFVPAEILVLAANFVLAAFFLLAEIFGPAANFVLAAFFLLAEIIVPAANFVPAAIFASRNFCASSKFCASIIFYASRNFCAINSRNYCASSQFCAGSNFCASRNICVLFFLLLYVFKSTTLAMARRSAHLITSFLGNLEEAVNQYFVMGARVLDSRPSGRGFEPHWWRCIAPLSKTHLS